MTGIFERFSERQKYRLASIGLLGGSALPFLLPIMGLAWGWILLGFIVSMAFYTALVVLTYYRLRDAWLSGWWLLLMIMVFHVGPKWDLGHSVTFHPSGFVALIPLMLGWFAPGKDAETLAD